MQLALQECTHAIFVIGCERGTTENVKQAEEEWSWCFGGVSPHGLERLFDVYKLSRVPVDFSVPVFKGYVRNPSVPYS